MPPPRTRPQAPRFYHPGEVARLFRVDTKTVTRWAKTGKLRSIRTPGNRRLYFADEIDAMLGRQP